MEAAVAAALGLPLEADKKWKINEARFGGNEEGD